MFITWEDILGIPCAEVLTPVAGIGGLDRKVRWLCTIEDPSEVCNISGGELVLTTGLTVGRDPEAFLKMIEELDQYGSAGLIVRLGIHMDIINKSILESADFLGYPIFSVPESVDIRQITKCICSQIFLAEQQKKQEQTTLLRLIDHQDLTEQQLQSIRSSFDNLGKEYLTAVFLYEETTSGDRKGDCLEAIRRYMEREKRRALIADYSLMTVVTFGIAEGSPLFSMNELYEWLREEVPDVSFYVGISLVFRKPEDYGESVCSAKLAIHFGRKKDPTAGIYDYGELLLLRIFRALSDTEVLRGIAEEIFEEITGEKQAELLTSLEMFFLTGGDIKEAANRLFIHENTLRYRMKKIEELLHRSVKEQQDLFDLKLAVQIREYLDYCKNALQE